MFQNNCQGFSRHRICIYNLSMNVGPVEVYYQHPQGCVLFLVRDFCHEEFLDIATISRHLHFWHYVTGKCKCIIVGQLLPFGYPFCLQ